MIIFSGLSVLAVVLLTLTFFYSDIVSALGLDAPKDKGIDHKYDTIAGQFLNARNEGHIHEQIAFIYSHPYQLKSYFVKMKDNKVIASKTLNATGLFGMVKDSKSTRDIWLWSDYTDSLYKMNKKMNISGVKQMSPYTFFIKNNEITISGYNKDALDNILEFKNKGEQKHQLTFPSIITASDYDTNYIYVYSDIINEERSALYVIERKTGKLIKEVPVSFHGGDDITLFKGNVIINTKENLTIVETGTWQVSYISLPHLKIHPEELYIQNNTLYLVYSDERANAGVLKFNEKFRILENKKLNFPYMTSTFHKNKLFILAQLPTDSETQFKGIMGVFKLDSWRKEGQMVLPERGHMVQNFIILD